MRKLGMNSWKNYVKMLPAAVMLLLSAPAAAVPLNLAVPSMQSGIEMLTDWTLITRYLEQAGAIEVELHLVKDHKAVMEGMLGRFYDVAFVNTLFEERLVEAGGGSIETRARAAAGGETEMRTLLIVHTDSLIRGYEDLRSGTLAQEGILALTLPEESFGGWTVPLQMFEEAGVDVKGSFSRVISSGSYLSILKGVSYGVIDVGVVSSPVLYSPEHSRYAQQIRVIAVSEPYPQWALVAQKELRQRAVDDFFQTLSAMSGSEEGARILASCGYSAFVPASGADDADSE